MEPGIGLPETAHVMDRLTFETALLFFRMRIAAREFLGQGEQSSGRRSLLKTLREHGPRTVPFMARDRSVSRQHIQKLVDSLRASGLVRSFPNPAHKRSVLIGLTAEGRRFSEEMSRREEVLWRFLSEGIPEEDLHVALGVVRELRGKFASEEWERVVDEARSSGAPD
jgi:DNA-binding MarR family transcriptional regulator